ncbi:MAG: TRAM domain-containing protein, partial [Bacillota bacterium]
DRIRRLIEVVNNVAGSVNQELVGTVQEVMVDGLSERDPSMMAGKTRQNKTVHWPARPGLEPGQLVNVMIQQAGAFTLRGVES